MDLMQAVSDGNEELVRTLVSGAKKSDLNKRGPNKSTVLMVAASAGNTVITRMLIEAGADLDLQDSDDQTALMFAICGQQEETVDLLLDAGARADIENWLAFDFAVRFGTPRMVKRLIDLGADVNRRDGDGAPPLLEAVNRGSQELVEMLIASGADHDATACGGQTAVSLAASGRNADLFEYLVDQGCPIGPALNGAIFTRRVDVVKRLIELGANVNEQDKQFGYTPLATATEVGDAKIVKMLIDAGADLKATDFIGQTPLCTAAMNGQTAVMKVLLDAGSDIRHRNAEGETILTMATWMDQAKAVEFLLERGADPNETGKNSPAPLLWAVAQDSQNLVKRLLDAGADPNAAVPKTKRHGIFDKYPKGTTALMIAAAKGRSKIVDILLEAGVDPQVENGEGRTAVDFAAKAGRGKVLERLERTGATVDRSSKELQDALLLQAVESGNVADVKKALAAGAKADATKKKGHPTALMTACLEGRDDIVRALLDAGAKVDRVCEWGQAPLRNAVVRGHTGVVRMLLEAGANPSLSYPSASIPAEEKNTVFPSMESPLMDAANLGRPEILELLIEFGADVNQVSESGKNPLLAAVWGRHFDLAKRLLAAGATRRIEDADCLAVLDWDENAAHAAYQESIREVAEACGCEPEPIDWLPGAKSFRFTVPEQKGDGGEAEPDVATAAIHWSRQFNEKYATLAKDVNEVLDRLAAAIEERGYHLLDAGMPLGCGPMTRFLVLLPSNDKYAIMSAFVVRGNDMELSNRDIVQWFRDFEIEVPFRLRGCKFDTVTIQLDAPLPNAKKWVKKLRDFCPDSFGEGTSKELSDLLKTTTRLTFWWD
ncbi:MAG: hypothetical protein AMXMBFR82_36310 [Candidatus Hydrogenedentota bacterium]